MKGTVATVVFSLAIIAVFTSMAYDRGNELVNETERRIKNGVQIEAQVTLAQANAIQNVKGHEEKPSPQIVHPPQNAVFPQNFPSPRLQWVYEGGANVFKVELRQNGQSVFRGVTAQHEITADPKLWSNIRKQSGVTEITVTAARIEPDGTLHSDSGSQVTTSFKIAPESDNPSGMILFGMKHRPANKPTGNVPLLMMHLRIDGFDFDNFKHRVVFRSSHGPEPTVMHPGRMSAENQGKGPEHDGRGDQGGSQNNDEHHSDSGEITSTQCVSCHAMSADGKRIAVFSQTAEEAPPSFDAPNGFLTVLEMPSRKVMIQLPHAFMPQFHPINSDLLAFGQVDETIGIKDQMMVRRSDIHVLDLSKGTHKPLPGAATTDRVENLPFWSPDGEEIVFIRTKPKQMWHGSAGHLDIATIKYNGGEGGEAQALKGASENNRSNFLPVYSRDGRWIVFTQADQGFFSQESSDLWIVPAAGGEARKLNCNSHLTESWHRFSPSGKWLATVTNREDVRRPHIYLSRFNTKDGTCTPAVQLPVVSGPGAHTHAFSWTKKFDWFDDYEPAER